MTLDEAIKMMKARGFHLIQDYNPNEKERNLMFCTSVGVARPTEPYFFAQVKPYTDEVEVAYYIEKEGLWLTTMKSESLKDEASFNTAYKQLQRLATSLYPGGIKSLGDLKK